MKILLDECVPVRFGQLLEGHQVSHVTTLGWSGVKNGDLLQRAVGTCNVLVSVDYKLPSHLNSEVPPIPIVLLHGVSNNLKHIQHLAPELLSLLEKPLQNRVYRLGS